MMFQHVGFQCCLKTTSRVLARPTSCILLAKLINKLWSRKGNGLSSWMPVPMCCRCLPECFTHHFTRRLLTGQVFPVGRFLKVAFIQRFIADAQLTSAEHPITSTTPTQVTTKKAHDVLCNPPSGLLCSHTKQGDHLWVEGSTTEAHSIIKTIPPTSFHSFDLLILKSPCTTSSYSFSCCTPTRSHSGILRFFNPEIHASCF